MKRKLAAIVAGAMMVGSVSANDIKMSPVFDISYLHSEADASGANQGQFINSRDDIDVQYAGIDFSGSSKSLSWLLGLNFAGDAANTTEFVDQATMSYAINDNFSFTAGRFYSFVGFEAARNNGEWNYTKSIAKTISPYWHEGVGASYDAKNGFVASVFMVDGVENNQDGGTGGAQSNKKGYGATLSYAMDKWRAELDYYTDGNRTNTTTAGEDTIYGASFKYDFNDKFSAALAAQMGTIENGGSDEWEYSSYAAYVKFQANEKLYFAARYELFSEENTGGALGYAESTTYFGTPAPTVTPTEHDVDSITLTAGHNFMNGSELKLEYRMDSGDEKIYTHDNTAEDSNNTIALAWLYSY